MRHLGPEVFPSVVADRINELRVVKGLSMEQRATRVCVRRSVYCLPPNRCHRGK